MVVDVILETVLIEALEFDVLILLNNKVLLLNLEISHNSKGMSLNSIAFS